MIYLDACALVKLVREENESSALRDFLDGQRNTEHITSELANAELMRTIRRVNHDDQGHPMISEAAFEQQLQDASDVLDSVSQIALDTEVVSQAGAIEVPFVRTLDALHLATAAQLGEAVTGFVSYDKGLLSAAEQAGLPTVTPR